MILPLVIAGLALLLLVLGILLLLQRRQIRQLRTELKDMNRVPPVQEPATNFENDLKAAESRLSPIAPPDSSFKSNLTDRYRCIEAMARQGLSAEQISSIMRIGEAEVRQVIRLANVSRR